MNERCGYRTNTYVMPHVLVAALTNKIRFHPARCPHCKADYQPDWSVILAFLGRIGPQGQKLLSALTAKAGAGKRASRQKENPGDTEQAKP